MALCAHCSAVIARCFRSAYAIRQNPINARCFAKLTEDSPRDILKTTSQLYLFTLPSSDVPVQPEESWLPWRRKLSFWEKFFWIGGGVVAAFVSYRYYASLETEAQKQARIAQEEALTIRRLQYMRGILNGQNFAQDDDDPFNGFTPQQIEDFLHENQAVISFEGMSPEEIDEYLRTHEGDSNSKA